jgi:predicted DCC family thiol-disulfide oxidoreductase YuxK
MRMNASSLEFSRDYANGAPLCVNRNPTCFPGHQPYALLVSSQAMTVLYDGECRFCTRSAHTIQRRFGRDRVTLENFQEPGALQRHPGVTHAAAMRKMHVVTTDGRIFAGAEAIARIVATVRFVGWLAYLYYVPGIKQLADLGYALIARYRYKLFGRSEACDGGTCHLHGT